MPPLNKLQKTGLALAISQGLCLSVCGDAQAATITVTSDQDDGTGCTLREAIASANTSANQNNGCAVGSDAGTDTITFSNSLVSNTIALVNGELSIGAGKNVNIDASVVDGGITIDGNFQTRLLNVNNSTVSMNAFSLTRGGSDVTGNRQSTVLVEDATFSLANSKLSNNVVVRYNPMLDVLSSELTMTNVTVSNNSLIAGSETNLLAFEDCSSVTLDNIAVNNNRSHYLARFQGNNTVSINATSISSNTAIYFSVVNLIANDSITITNSTISENTSRAHVIRLINNSSATVRNSTLSSNSPRDSSATSAFYITNSDLTLANSTVNDTAFESNFSLASYTYDTLTTQVSVVNSILTDSLNGSDCIIRYGDVSLNDIGSDTNSIIQGAGCDTQARQVDPLIGPLDDNSGPTLTHSLLAGSPAINTGNNATCPSTDQRGINRDSRCDVGAFEFVDESGFFVIPTKNGKTVVIPE